MPINPACLRAALILSVLTVQAGHAEAPLSAIDWLSQSVSAPAGNGVDHGTGSVANQPSTPGEVLFPRMALCRIRLRFRCWARLRLILWGCCRPMSPDFRMIFGAWARPPR